MKNILVLFIALLTGTYVTAQLPEFSMSDTLVTVCKGRLFDSGGEINIYGNNEDFTFTVCTDSPIEITFQGEFCVENDLDFLTIHDGPDISSPIISGPLTGIEIPAITIAFSGCATFHFTSDISVAYCGFDILWDSSYIEPIPPTISSPALDDCGINVISIELSYPILCNEVFIENSILEGQTPIELDSFIATNCDDDGLASTFDLTLAEILDYNCSFDLSLQLGVRDNCDSLWLFNQPLNFIYDQCEIPVEFIVGDDLLCNDQCTTISALAEGCFDFTYTWDNGLPATAGPHLVCPNGPLTYTVTIIEVQTGNSTVESYTFEHESVLIDQEDLILCQSDATLIFTANPPIGIWEGPGIYNSDSGNFDPDGAEPGLNYIFYSIDNSTCYDSVQVSLTEINAGEITASCPFATPTLLIPEPAGGLWTGDNISPTGVFSPQDAGIYSISYAVNGCFEELIIDVQDFTPSLNLGPLCQSANTQYLSVLPSGGIWYGIGIDDNSAGTWEPEWTEAGGDITLSYQAIGCSMEYVVNIIPAQIGVRYLNTCPFSTPFLISDSPNPTGGVYEGMGIQDVNTGLFDPSSVITDNWYDILYYAPNGCVDTLSMFVGETTILQDTVYFCVNDEPLFLNNENTGRSPWGGQWIGPGVNFMQNNDFEFIPSNAGPGEHLVYYDNNECLDSVLYIVFPSELAIDSMTVCSADEPFIIEELPYGGTWTGLGIINEYTGLFDPSLAAGETVTIAYSTPTNCVDELEITADEFIQAVISGIEETYCFIDLSLPYDTSPPDGLLTGPSINGEFNPAVLGEGIYTYNYSFPDISCSGDSSVSFTIYPSPTVNLSATDTVLCVGGGTVLTAMSASGVPDGTVTIEWSDNLIPIAEHSVSPSESQYYYVSANDGCSDPVTDSILITLTTSLELSYLFGDLLCFNEEGASVTVEVTPADNYDIYWNNELGTSSYEGLAGEIVTILAIEPENECEVDDLILIPSYSPIVANFTINPNLDCIPFEELPVSFIDISQNAVSGNWYFGNEETEIYDGSSPAVNYTTAGYYDVLLVAENEGGCIDSASVQICVNDPSSLFIPDIFSPNNDGANDILFVRGEGIVQLDFSLYNRWGDKVFSTNSIDNGWNGNVRGNKSPTGIYFYQLKARVNNGDEIVRSGDITLVR